MKFNRKFLITLLVVFIVMSFAFTALARDSGGGGGHNSGGGGSDSSGSSGSGNSSNGGGGGYTSFGMVGVQDNVELHLNEERPYVIVILQENRYDPYLYKSKNITIYFESKGDNLKISEMPKGAIFTVPEGYKAKCILFATVSNGGKNLGNGRVIYSEGTTVKFTQTSMLELFKK